MQSNFQLFGAVHIAILGSIPVLAAVLTIIERRGWLGSGRLRIALAISVVIEAVLQYGYFAARGWLRFPDSMPLELCDATMFVTAVALFTRNPLSFDLAYYSALAGTSMALLTPDLWEPFPSYSTVQFFVAHGIVVAAVLYMVWAKEARPRPGSVWRAFLGLNVFTAFVGCFNLVFGTNYMYLRAKPPNPSLLDFFGDWPWYLLVSEAVALVIFTLLYLPYRPGRFRALSETNGAASAR